MPPADERSLFIEVEEMAPIRCPLCGAVLLEFEEGEISLCPHALSVVSATIGIPAVERGDGHARSEHPLIGEPWVAVRVTFENNPYNWSWRVGLAWPVSRLADLGS